MTASISLRGVSQRVGATGALTDIDLYLVPGATGLLGPNGASKTTLLRLFATALAPTQGRVSVLGLDPAVPAQRTGIRRLGYLPQETGFPRGFSAFTFANYVAMKEWVQPAGRDAEVRRVLGQVGPRRPRQADPRHARRSTRVWVLAMSILLLAGRLTARADQPGPA